jgi:cell division protein FtsB
MKDALDHSVMIERLRDASVLCAAAAVEIAKLRTENAKLRETLSDIARGLFDPFCRSTLEARARAALSGAVS